MTHSFSCAQQMIHKHIYLLMQTFCELLEKKSPIILPLRHTPREVCRPCPFFMQQCLILKNVRMEDAAHCSHKPSSLSSPPDSENGRHLFGFLIFSLFFCDMPRGECGVWM